MAAQDLELEQCSPAFACRFRARALKSYLDLAPLFPPRARRPLCRGGCMNFPKVFATLLSLGAIGLGACSGRSNQACTVNCGGSGPASLGLTLTATPLTPPPNTNLLSFFVDINTITL